MLWFQNIELLIMLIPVMMLAVTIHEVAHGFTAMLYGDKTALRAGRLTLNPITHLDLVGSIAFLLIGFGWAKPVPVNYNNMRKKPFSWGMVAFAGPLSNLIIAVLIASIAKLMFSLGLIDYLSLSSRTGRFIFLAMQVNIVLAVFNLIPIAPLDGSKIVQAFFMKRNPKIVYQIEQYGPMILMGILAFSFVTGIPIIGKIIGPIVYFIMKLILY